MLAPIWKIKIKIKFFNIQYSQIVAHIGLKEIWYFGLEYTDSRDAKNWLKLNRKVMYFLVSLFVALEC
jgi:hypothetical protein